MIKKYIFSWFIMLGLLLASCSDDKEPISPPDPEPPTPEISEGINLSPEALNADAEATITFKATKTSALYGYTGDVYVHIGVADGTDWMYVPAGWDENISKCKMTKEEDNVWSITFPTSIRSWFGLPVGVPLQRLGVLFRSADGSKKGIENDSFILVDDPTFTPGEIVYASKPPQDLEGINVSGNSVTLVLYDKDTNGKYNDYAYVIGDFNDWKINADYKMQRDEASGCWWYTLTGLDAQREYAFQYYIGTKENGAIRLADAYTEKVIDPLDEYIPNSTYPGLRPYPSDKTAGIISTFKIQPDTYNWQVQNYKVEDKNNLVIYEMLLRDFTTSSDLNGAMEKLDYLQELGVNAIELMPVQEFDGNDSWGYNPCFFFAMDKAYGTKEMYKQFIDECHKRNIAVLLDVVYNHATGAHPFAKLYWNANNNETASNNPWFNMKAPHPYSVFHDFNHESPLVKAFVKRNIQFLLTEYKVDGFRFDLTKGFTQNSSTENTASNHDASRVNILKEYNAAIKEVNSDAVVILEHFCVVDEEAELAGDGMQLWRELNWEYGQSAMGYPSESAFTNLTTEGTIMPFGGWVGFMESHDKERIAYKQTQWGATEALKTDLATRMKQLETNASLFFTVPGPKMIWQFGELGYDVTLGDEDHKMEKKPVRWEYYNNPSRKGLYDTYSKLIDLRTSAPELFDSESTFVWNVKVSDWNNGRSLSLKANNGKGVVVVANFTSAAVDCTTTFPNTGIWNNYMDKTSTIDVSTERYTINVPAHHYYVYTNF